MKSIEHTIEVNRKAHYYTNSFEGSKPKYIWMVAHGYGQVAERILAKFTEFDEAEHLVICPEGLSLFYWGGVSGSYAASWMTSKNRLDEIDDFCNFLDQIYRKYIDEQEDSKVIFFGFSQGATTLYRWVHSRKPGFDLFVNWAGWFPEDIEMKKVKDMYSYKHLIVYGDEDQYLTSDKIKMMESILNREGYNPSIEIFKGKHSVDKDKLKRIFEKYIK